jgi:hypothetical protein
MICDGIECCKDAQMMLGSVSGSSIPAAGADQAGSRAKPASAHVAGDESSRCAVVEFETAYNDSCSEAARLRHAWPYVDRSVRRGELA